MTDELLRPLSKGRRRALAALGVHDAEGLVDFAAAAVADAVNRRNRRTRTGVEDARRWLAAAVHGGDVEHIDPATQDGWDAYATFTLYFQERSEDGAVDERVVVSHHENDEDEPSCWPGRDAAAAQGWIDRRLPARAPPLPAPSDGAAAVVPVAETPPPTGPTASRSEAMTSEVRTQHDRFRSIDGRDNGGRDLGAAGTSLQRLDLEVRPFDGGAEPNPRRISSLVCRQVGGGLDPWRRSEFVWAWGQFLDHELDLVKDRKLPDDAPADHPDRSPIEVPADDHRLEFRGTTIPFVRSVRRNDHDLPNSHTAYIDASNVYGTCRQRLERLRSKAGGKMATTHGRLLPHDTTGDDDCEPHDPARATGTDPQLTAAKLLLGDAMQPDARAVSAAAGPPRLQYLAGDIRANEHPVLLSLHTIFVREHNWWCDRLADRDSSWDDEELFQRARKLVGAEMQSVTYNEFLPALLGTGALGSYDGFDAAVDPGISVLFATACYRLGHSMVHDDVVLSSEGYSVQLADMFFAPEFVERLGVERWLSRLAYRPVNAIDPRVVDGLREFLFRNREGNGSQQMLDLAALNIQRGRDHGLPDFNRCRQARGIDLPPVGSFAELTGDPWLTERLEQAYGQIEQLDPWVGALSERPAEGRRVGDLLHATLVDQFTRLRDGDFYWFEHDPHLDDEDRACVRDTTLGDIIMRNAEPIDGEPLVIPRHVFHV